MADGLKKAAVWLGLVSDNDYAEVEPGAEDVTEQVLDRRDAEQKPAAATVTTSGCAASNGSIRLQVRTEKSM